ncbi:hypothetical protein [Stutzerimonas kirkiae]|uniref:hypothetical protein n=1 Tax=Stutzerimonas kirkiae TaxID=2211392 RepID=UPI0013F1641F|nr:hypothetical protein [Stutzerimonas kirkiae]
MNNSFTRMDISGRERIARIVPMKKSIENNELIYLCEQEKMRGGQSVGLLLCHEH